MKNYILLLLLSIFTISTVEADIYTSVSKKIEMHQEKKESAPIKLHWYGKAGINVGVTNGMTNNYHDLDIPSNSIGLDINAGFYSFFRPSNPSKFYWGADMSVGLNLVRLKYNESYNNLYYVTSQNIIMPYLNIAPQLGWTTDLSRATKLDIHIEPAGMFVSSSPTYNYYSHNGSKYKDVILFDSYLDGYSKIGVGIWHKNMIYEISYRQPWMYYPGTITLGVGVHF